MSEVRKIFYDLLDQNIASESYQLKKSKGTFEKKQNGLLYSIVFSWDGRGGYSSLKGMNGIVSIPEIEAASGKILAYKLSAVIVQQTAATPEKYRLTQMYSRKLIELANNMRFKEMAALSFEEKYPMENIKKTVDTISNFIKNEVVAFHNSILSEKDILESYIEKCRERLLAKEYHNISTYLFPIKLMCKKMKIEEPDFVRAINLFTNESIDDLWNMQYHDFENLEKKFNELKFTDARVL